MALALQQAQQAALAGEVPVGAVVVHDGACIGSGRNSPVADHDPSAHAEINALRTAAAARGNYRLDGCTVYVTLEPCAMCAGAMLHARVARVVYGATDPRTGAAGSVLDLFAQPLLNHHTQVQGGVAADACGALLQTFFGERRAAARALAQPLREDALRTPQARFASLTESGPGAHGALQATSDLPSLGGWRMVYRDSGADVHAGQGDAPSSLDEAAVLCLHGWGQWGHLFRHLWPRLAGRRVLVPDLIGFGRSDKPKRDAVHRLEWHVEVLDEWLATLGVRRVVVVHPPDMAALVQTLSQSDKLQVVARIEIAGSAADAETLSAWDAPFPDRGHAAALRVFGRSSVRQGDLDPAAAEALSRQIDNAAR